MHTKTYILTLSLFLVSHLQAENILPPPVLDRPAPTEGRLNVEPEANTYRIPPIPIPDPHSSMSSSQHDSYCPPPLCESGRCPAPAEIQHLDLCPSGLVLQGQNVQQVSFGIPYYHAPLPPTVHTFHSVEHRVRKRALFHISPGNMLPPRPIYPVASGSYYYRPYAYQDVAEQQLRGMQIALPPGMPYAETSASANYVPSGSLIQVSPAGDSGMAPSRLFRTFRSAAQ